MEAAQEEVEVLNSIYEDVASLSETTSSMTINIPETSVHIKVLIPLHYPDEAPKISSVSGVQTNDPSLSTKVQEIVNQSFVPGEVFMFNLIDEVRPLAEQWMEEMEEAKAEASAEANANWVSLQYESENFDRWISSEPIRDRGSTFIGRCIGVNTEDEAYSVLNDLLLDKRVGSANHNMTAWRLKHPDGSTSGSAENDGEAGSAAVLSHLLNIADVQNAVVIVSRFFSGVHIGADRFKHIKNAAKECLQKGGFLK